MIALIGLMVCLPGARVHAQTPPDFTPASGHAQVVAQGIAEFLQEEVFWRIIRDRAELPADAPFAERPLGFVVAANEPLLLADQGSGRLTRLGPGEATFVPAGTIQQRASLSDRPAGYLALELVSVAAPPDVGAANVLASSQPFVPTPGFHDLDLIRDVLTGSETFLVPDTGERNVIVATAGAIGVGLPGEGRQALLAGEAGAFSGALEVAVAAEGDAPPAADARAAFVVAMIGALVEPPLLETTIPTPTPATGGTGIGTIAIQVLTCPPGMRPETLAVAVCGPAVGDFDVTLTSDALGTTLVLADATATDSAFIWTDLPFGDYLLAEAVLPVGYDTYVVSAVGATGSPELGYTIPLTTAQPELTVRIYNFAPAATGSMTIQLFLCPRGMGPDNLVTSACRPAADGFDFTLTSDTLAQPLTVADAAPENPFTWESLPFGQYTLVQSTFPDGFATYLVRGPAGVEGSPETGYTVTLDEASPDVLLRVYDFRA
jgi:hypothetical protein